MLESAGGNQDLAIDTLLGMSDPEYRSEQPQPTRVERTPVLVRLRAYSVSPYFDILFSYQVPRRT